MSLLVSSSPAAGAWAAGVLVATAALAADPDKPATASGTFEDRRWKLDIAGAYAYWDKSGGEGNDRIIRVAVSNAGFQADALDGHYDRGHAIASLFADDEVKVVNFEFEPGGRYLGLS